MSTGLNKTHADATAKRPNRLLVAFVTLAVLVGAMTLTQAVAWASVGEQVVFTGSPGLFALVATAWLAAASKSWEFWRRWIWLPLLTGVALSVIVVSLTVAVESAAEEQAEQQLANQCASAEGELTRLTDSHDGIVATARQFMKVSLVPNGWIPRPPAQPRDWTGGEATASWEYYVSNEGPQLKDDIDALEAAILRECP